MPPPSAYLHVASKTSTGFFLIQSHTGNELWIMKEFMCTVNYQQKAGYVLRLKYVALNINNKK